MVKKITREVEENINSLSYYYNRQMTIRSLYELMSKKYNEIYTIHTKIEKLNKEIEKELYGHYSDVFTFDYKDDTYNFKEHFCKIRDGKLENLTEYLNEKDEKTAINKYLKSLGAKFFEDEIINIDDLLGVNYTVEDILGDEEDKEIEE